MQKIPERELKELESIIVRVDVDNNEEVAKIAWELSHREDISQEVASLATDTALAAEGDYTGEFENKEQLLGALKQLRNDF